MSIYINPKTTLEEISSYFNTSLPYLNLAFFRHPHSIQEGSRMSDMIDDLQTKVGSLTTTALNYEFEVNENMTAIELEHLFETDLHLHIQVIYKAGNAWLETIESDHKSLKELQHMAEERNRKLESIEPGDYHEQS